MKIKEKTSQKSGITLIALVITIIVLLILAGVSVATLTGDNGILTQAQSAKEQAQIAEIVEKAQLDIVEIQTQNNGEFTITDLTNILTKYFTDVPETLPDNLSTLTLNTKEEYGSYLINVSQIHEHNYIITELRNSSSTIKDAYNFKDVEIRADGALPPCIVVTSPKGEKLSVGDIVYANSYSNYGPFIVNIGYYLVTSITDRLSAGSSTYRYESIGSSYQIKQCTTCGYNIIDSYN